MHTFYSCVLLAFEFYNFHSSVLCMMVQKSYNITLIESTQEQISQVRIKFILFGIFILFISKIYGNLLE